MAEGLEVEIPLSSQRYFCHLCIREVSAVHPDLTCPRCHSGFIEEVAPEDDAESDESDLDIEAASPMIELNLSDLIRRTIRRTILDFEEREGLPNESLRQSLAGVASRLASGERPSQSEERVAIPVFPVAEISGDLGPGSFRDLFHLASNLGDYAFGVEWDAIITQILNEDEVTGTPPLDKAQIEAIPMVSIEKEHTAQSLQCTVCMEYYELSEKVKSLPCEHLFHKECIVPWLEMHATCPICRKQINSS